MPGRMGLPSEACSTDAEAFRSRSLDGWLRDCSVLLDYPALLGCAPRFSDFDELCEDGSSRGVLLSDSSNLSIPAVERRSSADCRADSPFFARPRYRGPRKGATAKEGRGRRFPGKG